MLDFTFRQGKELLKQRSSFKRDFFLILSLLLTIISWLVIVIAPPFIFGLLLTAFGVPYNGSLELGADFVLTKDFMFNLKAEYGLAEGGDEHAYGGGFSWQF